MSNTQVISATTSTPAIPTTFTADTGVATPAANNLNVVGGAGIETTGSGDTITISLTGPRGTVTTTNNTPTTVLTIDAGATAGTYALDVLISAFNTSIPAGASISIWGGVRTTGAATVLTGVSDSSSNSEAALAGVSAVLAVSGNNILVQVTGIAATTINWAATARYEFVS